MTTSRLRSLKSLCAIGLIGMGAYAQSRDSLLHEAWYWQDQRVGGADRLRWLASSKDAEVRAAAFRALAHRNDSGTGRILRAGLSDAAAAVRTMAAFAAGQRWSAVEAFEILEPAMMERDPEARRALFDAFGRLTKAEGLDTLASKAANYRGDRRSDAMTAVMRAAIRGVRSPAGIWYAFASLTDVVTETRWRALYALGRMAPHPLLATEVAARRKALVRLVDDRSPDVRMNLATMLARVDVPEAREILRLLAEREFVRRDRDWRVLVQTVRSAAAQMRAAPELIDILLRGLADRNDHVAIATAMALPGDGPDIRALSLRDSVRTILWRLIRAHEGRAPMVAGEAMVALARFHPDDVKDLLDAVSRQTFGPRLTAKALEAFSMSPTAAGWGHLASSLDDTRPSVAMAAWDHARRFLRSPGIGAVVPELMTRQQLSTFILAAADRAFARRDMGISTVVASVFGDSSVIALVESGGYRERAVQAVANALRAMTIPDDVEAMQAALQALGALGGNEALASVETALHVADASVVDVAVRVLRSAGRTDVTVPTRSAGPAYSDYDWALLQSLGPTPTAVFRTDRGTVIVDLLPKEAPFTVLSFVRLARRGYFDGLTFHRVVPNFVAQGGDPRGDGWGGPGYALRTEVTPRSYERGSVGMASAGRDTEGSQFFFTHLPTPHLDARYTIFARVREGMGVLDRWQVGDAIREVRVTPGPQRGARSR